MELSVRSLNLIFLLIPPVANDVPPPSTNLADSISEAAQLFAHEEITREESTEAYQAFQSSGAPHTSKNDDYVPGGLNASTDEPEVLSDVDPTGISMFASMFEYLLSQFTFSAKDISITVIHPGHSSFRFKVSELRYGRPTPGSGESTRTLSISGVEIAHCDLSTSNSPSSSHPESRSLSSTPCEFSAPSHRVDSVALSSTVASPSPPNPLFSLEGGSDSNEPVPSAKPVTPSTPENRSRPSSPSGSTSSSLFQSALTTQGPKLMSGTCDDTIDHSLHVEAHDIEPNSSSGTVGCLQSQADETRENEHFYRVIVSLATEPIVVHITTSAPSDSSRPPVSNPYASGSGASGSDYLQPNLEISVSLGILACALTTGQISAILAFVSAVGSYSGPSAAPPVSNNPGFVVPSLSLLDQAKLTIQIRGFVLLLQSVTAPLTSSSHDDPLADFFAHPLTPPSTNHNYVRFLIDRLKADLSVSTALEQVIDEPSPSPEHLPGRSRVPRMVRGTTSSHIGFSINDLSALAFCMPSNATARPASHATFVLPIVLTDHFLSTQYRPEHHPPPNMDHHLDSSEFIRKAIPALPEFEILDWTSEDNRTNQAKLTFWRVRPPPSYRRPQRDHLGDSPAHPPVASLPKAIFEEKPANKPQSALSGQMLLSTPKDSGTGGSSEPACSIQINIAPLHVFVDLGSIAAALDFLETLSFPRTGSDSAPSQFGPYEPKEGDYESASRRTNSRDLTAFSSPQRRTLQQIHRQELEDLNLSVDYLSKEPVFEEPPPVLRKDQRPIQVFTYVLPFTFSRSFAKLSKQEASRHDARTEFEVSFVMIRVQIRCPSPPSLLQRSGAVILDIHALTLTSRSPLGVGDMYPGIGTKTESTHQDSSPRDNHLLTAEWRTLLLACSSAMAETARGFCSVGPLLPDADTEVPASHDHIRFRGDAPLTRRFSFVKLSQNLPPPSGQNSRRSAVVTEIDIPSIVLNISKPLFDGLQFWVDDVSQLLERTTTTSNDAAQENTSRNPSLLGSRFFSNSKHSSVEIPVGEIPSDNIKSSTESIVKVTISEGESLHVLNSLVLTRHSFHEALNSSERG